MPRKLSLKTFTDGADFTWTKAKGLRTIMIVRNQGETNTCWAFATTDCLSIVEFLEDEELDKVQKLSIQQLLDFVHLHPDYQPDSFEFKPSLHRFGVGNSPGNALHYVLDNGLCSEKDYDPYVGKVNQDRNWDDQPSGMNKLFIKDFQEFELRDVNSEVIFNVVKESGPMVGVVPLCKSFYDIKDEVYKGPKKDEMKKSVGIDYHSVLIVGYGKEDDMEYCLIKNSYGKKWGVKGFGKIAFSAFDSFYGPIKTYRAITKID